LRCDIRGMRADDAIRAVDAFLDDAFRAGHETAIIVHGHGTGALKQAIREHLDASRYVKVFRPGDSHEGGDGVTVASFQ
jgi:DNA mismatch repair protein MutS2